MKARFRALLSSTTVPNALLSAAIICVVVAGVRRHRLGRTQRAVLALPPALCLAAAAYHYVADLHAESDICTVWKKFSLLAKVKQKLAANRAESSKITICYETISSIHSSRYERERRGMSIFRPNRVNDKFYAWCLSMTQPTPPSSPIHMSTSLVLWLSSLTRSRPKHSPLDPKAPSFAPKILQDKNINILSSERGKKTTTFLPSRSTTRAENIIVLSSERVKKTKAGMSLPSPRFHYSYTQSPHLTHSYPPLPTARFESSPQWFIPPAEPTPLRIVYPTSRRARSLERREAGYPPGPAHTPMVPGSRRWRAAQKQTSGRTRP
ncbi:hypothetical protein BDZ89DRAFT_1160062 [Hymenopellis radicata]|nr:hypothetical protein BDZ89DRAFT_1160062 [Hymenopellis radicata]